MASPTSSLADPPDTWGPAWRTFLAAHGQWWDRHAGEPGYWLPEPVIARLADGDPPRPALIDAASAAGERAFAAVCARHARTVIGCWGGRPVTCTLFEQFASPRVTAEQVRTLNWLEPAPGLGAAEQARRYQAEADRYNRQLAETEARGEVYRRLMAGWAARVSFREDYRTELAAVRARWDALAPRPSLPLQLGVLADLERAVAHPDRSAFAASYRRLLVKWQVSRHLTWDLPLPLAPQESISLGLACHLFGPEWLVPVIPAYAAFPERANRPEVESAFRHRNATAVGLPADALSGDLVGHDGKDHGPSQQLRLYLFELGVRRRYGRPRGLASRLVRGFAEFLELSADRVKQLRGGYLPLLNDPSAG